MSLSSDLRALRFRYLNRQLRDFELQEPDPEELEPLTEQEIEADLAGRQTNNRFLGFFSRRGLIRIGFTFGIIQQLRKRGFRPRLCIVSPDPPQQMLRIYDRVEDPEHLLIEIAAHLEHSRPKPELGLPPGDYKFLVIDWMLLQTPGGAFSAARPRLPGQNHPGLRIGEDIGNVLLLMTERLGLDGLLTFPNHYHNAVLYGRLMVFANPRYQAEMIALGRDLSSLTLAERSWAVELGCVEDAQGNKYRWRGTEMIYPISPGLREHLHSETYRAQVEEQAAKLHYRLDLDRFTREYGAL